MEGRSTRFDVAVVEGGPAFFTVDVQRAGIILAENLPFLPDAKVTIDGAAAIRRTFAGTVIDEDGTLTPRSSGDALSPYGAELVVRVGFRFVDGSVETLPVGVFRITEAEATGQGRVRIKAKDRAVVVQEARFETPYVIAGGTRIVAPAVGTPRPTGALPDLIDSRYPGLTYEADTSITTTIPLTVFEEGDRSGDPWKNAQQIAASAGLEVFFSPRGEVVIRKVPDPSKDPAVWTYGAREEEEIKLGATNRLTADGVKNVAIVSGESSQGVAPVRAVVEVTDPTSPLYPPAFGRRPIFYVSSLVTSMEQAVLAAQALLIRKAGGSEQLTIDAAPHPAHEAGDVVLCIDANLAGGQAFAVLDSWTLPLSLRDSVTYQTLARRSL